VIEFKKRLSQYPILYTRRELIPHPQIDFGCLYHGYVMKQFYTSDEAVMAAEAPKVKKRRPNTPNVPPQPATATPILDPDQKELKEEEIANLKGELKEQVESRQQLDVSIAKKMKRLKELGEDKYGVKWRVVNMHYILSDNKAGKAAVDLGSGVVLYSDLLDGVVYQKPKPKPKQQSVHNNTLLMSAEQNNTTTVESDPSAPAKQAPNLSLSTTARLYNPIYLQRKR
jgi:hypothetical protein